MRRRRKRERERGGRDEEGRGRGETGEGGRERGWPLVTPLRRHTGWFVIRTSRHRCICTRRAADEVGPHGLLLAGGPFVSCS